MKKITTFIFLLILPVFLSAQMEITCKSVERVKQNVEIRFEARTTSKTLKKCYKLVLSPYLYHKSDTLWLQETAVYGKIRYKRERQEAALNGNKEWTLPAGQVMEGDTLFYAATVPYRKWMRTASLNVKRRMIGCNCDCYDGDETLLANVPVYVPPVPVVAECVADPAKFKVKETRKLQDFDSTGIALFFPVSETALYPDRYGNQATLNRIARSIHKNENRKEVRLNRVEITGFASPEGNTAFNHRLGKGRAEALKTYLQKQMPELEAKDIRLFNGGENWDGLRRMVAESDKVYKKEVLDILDRKTGDARKTALRKLAGGKPYRDMLKTFYPKLRSACCVALYYDLLSDAATDAIQAANQSIRAGKYAEALAELLKYETDERAWNSIGVCYMMLEDEEKAIVWFEKALAAGHSEASQNLEQIK